MRQLERKFSNGSAESFEKHKSRIKDSFIFIHSVMSENDKKVI